VAVTIVSVTEEQAPSPSELFKALLAEHASRRRVLDDQMFEVQWDKTERPATFRLQLFTGKGCRPAAVATQIMGPEGPTLINMAERYAEAVWRRHFFRDVTPPIWIQRALYNEDSRAFHYTDGYTSLVTFRVTGPHQLASPPRWATGLKDDQVTEVVGCVVDLGRGEGYIPRPPEEPVEEMRLKVMLTVGLPRPVPWRQPGCMPAVRTRWRSLSRQLMPRRGGLTCCWYHGGDWHEVSNLAIRLLRQARGAGVAEDEIALHVAQQQEVKRLSGWRFEALDSLFIDPIQLDEDNDYANGQHRAQALLDVGVRRIVVGRWRLTTAGRRMLRES
jgi:hypothetical protein